MLVKIQKTEDGFIGPTGGRVSMFNQPAVMRTCHSCGKTIGRLQVRRQRGSTRVADTNYGISTAIPGVRGRRCFCLECIEIVGLNDHTATTPWSSIVLDPTWTRESLEWWARTTEASRHYPREIIISPEALHGEFFAATFSNARIERDQEGRAIRITFPLL